MPRLSESGISRLEGTAAGDLHPHHVFGVGRVEADLGVGPIEQQASVRRDTQMVERVERRAEAADAGHVEARHEQDIGGALQCGEGALVEACRRVHDHVVEALGQQGQHLCNMRMPDRVGVHGVGGTGEDEQPVDGGSQMQLDRGGIDLARSSQLCERVVGGHREGETQVTELDVEIDGDHPAGVTFREGDGEVGGDGSLAGAALR